ncbi:MAG: hypothetical protein ACRES9_11070 [Gammaproteobacteria bacterium]
MFRYIKPLSMSAFVSGCALLLSACGGGGGTPQPPPQPAVITAHADIPESVFAGSTSTINVSLTAPGNPSGTAKVQLVDVGTAIPQINCGAAQTLSIGGDSGNFGCQAPQINLGSSNEHQLQVNVNGKPNLSSSVPVYVENGGRVYATLTSASGAPIEEADLGQTFDVSFSAPTASQRAVAGQYTVTAPSGWAVGSNGACTIDADHQSCEVSVTVPTDANLSTYGLDLDKAAGSSLLSPYLLPVTVEGLSLGGAGGTHPLSFDLDQNISDTLYTGSQFKYRPVFLFKNKSGHALKITSVKVQGLTDVKSGCVAKPNTKAAYTLTTPPPASAGCTLAPISGPTAIGPLYAVSGALTTAPALSTKSVAVTISGSAGTLVNYRTEVTFVPYEPGEIAVRIVPPASGSALHVAAAMEKWKKCPKSKPKCNPLYMIKFTAPPYLIGKISGSVSTHTRSHLPQPTTCFICLMGKVVSYM